MTKTNYNRIRKLYSDHHNIVIPKGYHIHHITPVHAGGTDNIENLIMLSCEEHALAHKQLYEEHGNIKDFLCYKMLSGFPPDDVLREVASMGGKIGGARVYIKKLGIHAATDEVRSRWASMGGKVGGKKCKELKKGIHGGLYQTKEWKHEQGVRQGKFMVEHRDWANVESQRARGKKGGVKNKGFIWITDGINIYKYTAKMQQDLPIDKLLEQNKNFRLGCRLNSEN